MDKRYPKTILATACIPWDDAGYFMEEVFRRQVRHLVGQGIRHIYLFGTAGEGYAVTDEQYQAIVSAFADEMQGPGLYPMVGLISLSLQQMKLRLEFAREKGIRDFQFVLPSWGALSTEETDRFFHELCGSYPDCRFMHYNLLRAKKELTVADYVRLAKDIPNLAAAKFTTRDLSALHQMAVADCPVQFFPTETGFNYIHLLGRECGLLLSIGTMNLQRAKLLYETAGSGRLADIAGFQHEVAGLLRVVIEAVGGGSPKMDGVYDKLYCKLQDPEFPLRLLPPYESGTEQMVEKLAAGLRERYPQWLEQTDADAGR